MPSFNSPTLRPVLDAFASNHSCQRGNTRTEARVGSCTLYLHNNPIVRWTFDGNAKVVEVSNANWPTQTTHRRIGQALDALGLPWRAGSPGPRKVGAALWNYQTQERIALPASREWTRLPQQSAK